MVFEGDLPGIFTQNLVNFEQAGDHSLLIWSAPGCIDLPQMMQPTEATWNLTIRT
jgi:hypothetical protein